jgi:hypothetical protein
VNVVVKIMSVGKNVQLAVSSLPIRFDQSKTMTYNQSRVMVKV